MATKARTRSRKKAAPKKQTTLTEDLQEILKSLDLFRAKHRIVHVQLHSVDTDWVEENDKTPEKGGKCAALRCPECTDECETCTVGEDCECDCTCDGCSCDCDDCDYCDKCNGNVTPVSSFREYWDESTGKIDTFKDWSPVMVSVNQADADNLWTASGALIKEVVSEIGTDISNELEEQEETVKEFAAERIEAEKGEANTLKVIERLKLLHTPFDKSAAELAYEQGDACDPSVERFKRLDLD